MSNVFYTGFDGIPSAGGNRFGLRGRWGNTCVWENAEHLADNKKWGGKHVPPKWSVDLTPNGITDEGIHYNLDTAFTNNDTAETAWYAGLIDNAGFVGVAAADTAAQIGGSNGWSESSAYSEATREVLSFAAAASRSITAEVQFTMNATVTIDGLFVVTASAKAATTGVLWSTALYTTGPDLESGNVLTSNYTLSD